MSYTDGCGDYWKDHCEPIDAQGVLWRFPSGEIVAKDDPTMEKNDWRQCAIRRHDIEVEAAK
jgi:hypothetical protein